MNKFLILLIVAMFLIVGCSGDDGGDEVPAADVGRQFLVACMNSQLAEANSLLTASTGAMVAANGGDPCGYLDDKTIYTTEAFTVIDEQIAGTTAVITYQWPQIETPAMIPRWRVTLVQADSEWRVSALDGASEPVDTP